MLRWWCGSRDLFNICVFMGLTVSLSLSLSSCMTNTWNVSNPMALTQLCFSETMVPLEFSNTITVNLSWLFWKTFLKVFCFCTDDFLNQVLTEQVFVTKFPQFHQTSTSTATQVLLLLMCHTCASHLQLESKYEMLSLLLLFIWAPSKYSTQLRIDLSPI